MTRFRTWMFDSRRFALANLLWMPVLFPGCATRGNNELLEAELRRQEAVIQRYEREAVQLQNELAVTQREMDLLRSTRVAENQQVSLEENLHSLGRVEGIVFNTLLTAGQNLDKMGGDEAFHAVFYPHDAQGEVVKLSGRVKFEAIDLARPPDQKSIGQWEFSTEESRDLWHAGFLSSGFQIDEKWQEPPLGDKILLLAHFHTADGRKFEATHTISITRNGKADIPALVPEMPSAQAVQPVKFEQSAESKLVPEPAEWEFASPPTKPMTKPAADNIPAKSAKLPRPNDDLPQKPATATLKSSLPETGPQAPVDIPQPFPGTVETSDNWTDADIPARR